MVFRARAHTHCLGSSGLTLTIVIVKSNDEKQALGLFMEDEACWERLIGTVEDRALSERVRACLCVGCVPAAPNTRSLDPDQNKHRSSRSYRPASCC